MTPRVLGITGRKRSGKDTLAKTLIEYGGQWTRIAFADKIKEATRAAISPDILGGDGEKERAFQEPLFIDNFRLSLSVELGIELVDRGLTAKNPRQLLQLIGTEYVRHVAPTYWLDIIRAKIESDPERRFIVTDVRMADEADLIRELGGTVIEVRRLYQDPPAMFVMTSERLLTPETAEAIKKAWTEAHPLLKMTLLEGGLDLKNLGGPPIIKAAAEHATEDIDFRADYVLAVVDGNLALPRLLADADYRGKDIKDIFDDWDWRRIHEMAPYPWTEYGLYYGSHVDAALAGKRGR